MVKTVADFLIEIIQSKGFTVGFMLAVIIALGYDNWTQRERQHERIIKLEQKIQDRNNELIRFHAEQNKEIETSIKYIEEQNQKILRILESN